MAEELQSSETDDVSSWSASSAISYFREYSNYIGKDAL